MNRKNIVEKTEHLLFMIEDDLTVDMEQRKCKVGDDDLNYAMREVSIMLQNMKDGTLPPKDHRQAVLTKMVEASWPEGELRSEVVAVEKLYRKM